MALERIDVEVTDKVDGGVSAKLIGIADAAERADSSVARLKQQLAAISSGPIQALKAATATITQTLNSELTATRALRQATDASAAADLKAATARERLAKASAGAAVAAARVVRAEAQAAEATSKASLAALRLADAEELSAAKKLRSAEASDRAAAAALAEASAVNQATEAAQRRTIIHDRTEIPQGSGAMFGAQVGNRATAAAQTANMKAGFPANDNDSEKVAKATAETEKFEKATDKASNTMNKARFNGANLAAQFQDIGVSLAGGQNPLLVFIQQGSQISYIASTMEQGWLGVAKAAYGLIAPFTLVAAAIGGLYLGFKSFTEASAKEHEPELVKYANSLGLTSKEMRKLGDDTVGANGKLKSFNTVTITMGDSWNGLIATIKEGLAATFEPFEQTTGFFKTVWGAAMSFGALAFEGFYASVMTLLKLLANSLSNTVKIVLNIIIGLAEGAVIGIQYLVNAVIAGINFVGDAANSVSEKLGKGKLFDTIGKVDLGVKSIGQNALKLDRMNIGETFNGELKTVDNTLKAIGKRWDENNVKIAKTRIKKAADAMIDNRGPGPKAKKEADPKTQSDYLDDENKKLDNQLSRMKMLKDAREEQQQLDQIQESFAKRRMPLDAAQLEGFRQRIHAIQEYKYQQAEMDRIYESATGPLRTYNAATAAAADLLARGAISQAAFNEEVNKASRTYKEATDPLFSMKEAMDGNEASAKLYGDAVAANNYSEQVRLALLAKGIDLTKNATEAQIADAKALVDRNNALNKQQYVQQTVGQIVNPMLEDDKFKTNKQAFYDEIDRMRQADVLSEDQAARAKAQLANKYLAIQLSGAETFFDSLSQLSQSKNSELAAIGKAAAVISATIKGYEAVQNTLATIPPPFNIPAAAAMAAVTGVQVANILSTPTNVGSFNNGTSFIVNGEHGIDQNTISMNVSRGERVSVETPGQQAAKNDNEGRAPVNLKVVNVTDKRDIHDAMSDEDGTEVIMNIISRNRKKIGAQLGVKS